MYYYSIGDVSQFLGISRDTIKFYEEKGLVSPIKDEENGYRKYNVMDIHNLLLVNFYREIDIEIKALQALKENEEFVELDRILEMQENKLKEEIRKRKECLNKIKEMKENSKNIKKNLDKFSIRPMGKFEVIEEFRDYNLEDPREIFEMNVKARKEQGLKQKPNNLGDMIKVINFTDKELLDEQHLIVRKLTGKEKDVKGKVLEYNKCAYTIVKIKAIDNPKEGEFELLKQYTNCLENVALLNEKHIGKAFLKMSLSAYENDGAMMYLEIYVPLEENN